MGRFVIRRLLQAIPTLLGIMTLTFALTRLAPGDPVSLMVPPGSDRDPLELERLRQVLGLNDPLPTQFARWAWGAVRLDFGNSFLHHRPVIDLILERLPNSLQLSFASLVMSLAIGVPLGLLAAFHRGRPVDHAIRLVSVVGHAVPAFWFGLLFVIVFALGFGWFPTGSMSDIGREDDALNRAWHMVGPVLTLSLAGIANYPRYLRTEVLEILSQDFVVTARGKGLREQSIIWVHIFRNALLPIVSLLGGVLAVFMSGAVVVEQIFSWPGLGRLTFEAAVNYDYPVIQATVFASSVLLLLSYVLRDITYAWVDPRIRLS